MRSDQASTSTRLGTRIAASALIVLLAVATILFVLKPLQFNLPGYGLDSSWIAVLGESALRPAHWGVDLTFNYGPASALVTRYFTDRTLTSDVPISCCAAAVFAFCFMCLVRTVAGPRKVVRLAALAVLCECVALFAIGNGDPDPFYFAFALTVFLLDIVRLPRDRAGQLAVAAGAAILGVFAMSKSSYGVLSLVLFILADARAAIGASRWPIPVPVFLLAALATFVAYGQHLADLPDFLKLQGGNVMGYGEAMYLPVKPLEIAAFLAGGAALVAALVPWGSPHRPARLCASAGVAIGLVVVLKAGFVRADTHPQIAWAFLGLAGLVSAIGVLLPRHPASAAVLGAGSLLVLTVVAPLFLLVENGQPVGRKEFADLYGADVEAIRGEATAWAGLARDPVAFAAEARANKAAAWAAIRAGHPLPNLPGSVDIISSEQTAVLANGLDYRPRPSFQDYQTYATDLIAANVAFYRSAAAPDWVLIAIDPIDDRYPASIDGALWPELMARYVPDRIVDDWLVLKRRDTPLGSVLRDPKFTRVELGQPVRIPPGAVFARIEVRKTLLGRLAAALFRPPGLDLRVEFADGKVQTCRFIPALAAEGFVLSPFVDDIESLLLLSTGHADDLGDKAIDAVTVSGSSGVRAFYQSEIEVTLQTIDVPRLETNQRISMLVDEASRRRRWLRLAQQIGPQGSLSGDHLSVPAGTSVTVPTRGITRLRLGFGIEDGAWIEGKTEGVCFSVSAGPDAPAPLWRRCLDPKDAAADRGPQTATVDLPASLASVMVAATCPKSCDWGWSYLNDAEAAP